MIWTVFLWVVTGHFWPNKLNVKMVSTLHLFKLSHGLQFDSLNEVSLQDSSFPRDFRFREPESLHFRQIQILITASKRGVI